jgi:hypothetical protein
MNMKCLLRQKKPSFLLALVGVGSISSLYIGKLREGHEGGAEEEPG